MKYFFDTEFLEDGRTIDLISIGMVSEDDREYYAVSAQCDWVNVFMHPWLVENVVPHLPVEAQALHTVYQASKPPFASTQKIAKDILEFVGDDESPEFWAWYASYDWVALCQLYGPMINLPDHFPQFCRDLRQVVEEIGRRPTVTQTDDHHALGDARWLKKAYYELEPYRQCKS